MKKIKFMALLMLGAFALSACDSDRDDNPVLTVPESFNLLKPEIGDNVIDLEHSSSLTFEAEKAPDYSFPTATTYWLQVAGSDNSNFQDKSKVYSVSTTGGSITYEVPAREVDYCVMQTKGWKDRDTFDAEYDGNPITIYCRLVACPRNATDSANYVYSTVQSITVHPYFIKKSLPKFWFIVGDNIADGSWKNDHDFDGIGNIQMYVKEGQSYDDFTGDGVVSWTGYLEMGGIKILTEALDWNYGLCGGTINSKGASSQTYRDGGDDPGNITVEEAGYYTIDVNTTSHALTATKYEDAVTNYTSISLGSTTLAATNTKAENHDWYAEITFTSAQSLTFTANDGTTWGSTVFPCAIGNKGGNAIPVEAGTYKVFFNDITGAYSFVEQD